jgi:hypothetical protein
MGQIRVDRRTILKWTLQKQGATVSTGSILLHIGKIKMCTKDIQYAGVDLVHLVQQKEPARGGGGGKDHFELQGLIQEDKFLGFAGRGPCYTDLAGILLSRTVVQSPARKPHGL